MLEMGHVNWIQLSNSNSLVWMEEWETLDFYLDIESYEVINKVLASLSGTCEDISLARWREKLVGDHQVCISQRQVQFVSILCGGEKRWELKQGSFGECSEITQDCSWKNPK